MALVNIPPTRVRVAWDGRRARPARIIAHGRRLEVVGLRGRRDELSAFRPERGPRVTYLLDTSGGDISLVFDARRRAWYIEAVESLERAA